MLHVFVVLSLFCIIIGCNNNMHYLLFVHTAPGLPTLSNSSEAKRSGSQIPLFQALRTKIETNAVSSQSRRICRICISI